MGFAIYSFYTVGVSMYYTFYYFAGNVHDCLFSEPVGLFFMCITASIFITNIGDLFIHESG